MVLLTEALLPYPHNPASIMQDQVDLIVQIEQVGDADKIGADATRMTSNPRELLIARSAADVVVNSGYFKEGFSLQTGTGGASLAVTRFLEDKMRSRDIHAGFALGGITSTIVDLHEKGFIKKLLDVQSFDRAAAESLARNPNHIEISANQYANWGSKGASVDRLDVVVLSALEVDTHFNVNVLTGSDGVYAVLPVATVTLRSQLRCPSSLHRWCVAAFQRWLMKSPPASLQAQASIFWLLTTVLPLTLRAQSWLTA